MTGNKKPLFLADGKKENRSQNFMKKSPNSVKTKEKNRFFYINKNLLVNNC